MLDKYTDEELLKELVRRNSFMGAGYSTYINEDHVSGVIGIGKDHHASIYLHKEDLEKLINNY